MSSIIILQSTKELAPEADTLFHVFGKDRTIVCDTDRRGYEYPGSASPLDLAVEASEGFIPLWAKGTILRWRVQKRGLSDFVDPAGVVQAIRTLFGEAIVAWGDAVPIKFTENDDLWDFEIVVRNSDNCHINGCVLASAFFPDGGRHEFVVYPKMFAQSRKEQVDTFIHETGHIFGLRHFFANISEKKWPSEIFGTCSPFSIMNYGDDSTLTETDKNDLRQLYESAWSGRLTDINGTPIRLVQPYHVSGLML
ncbi:matrixin family metalloprotease [Janthinobacterium sp. LB3P118]|uniref:matrixin family metalloprotease n=1 Tax=Janthinobacterium sp. LB3P118 TaxID=3424195 RepID=UPI003F26590D